MKLLITGGAGFIGSNFVHYWHEQHPDDQMIVLDKLTYAGNLNNLQDLLPDITFLQGDICDASKVQEAMSGCDAVVHFAAESHVDRSISDPGIFVRTNVLGTQVLLDATKALKISRFHHVSTDEVYGQLPLDTDERWTEDSPYQPRSPYSASKAGADHLVRAYFHTFHLPVSISNCANNYGPWHYPEKLIPLAITNLLENKKVPVYERGEQIREWLHVKDHCAGIEAVLLRGHVGETYCIGPGEQRITNLDIVQKILRAMDKDDSWIAYVPDRPGHDQRYALSPVKIQTELGWHASIDLDTGLAETVDWYKHHTDWWQPIKSGEYKTYYEQQYASTTDNRN